MAPGAAVARALLLPLLLPLLRPAPALGALPESDGPRALLRDALPGRRLPAAEAWGPALPPDLPELAPACRHLLQDLARSGAALTGCLVRSARPVRLCQACYPLFLQVAGQVDNISRALGNSSESHGCARSLLMADRVQMVVMLSEFFNSTWEKANCANCLVNTSEELSNSTVHFFTLFNQTLTCFENNVEENIQSLLPSASSEVCRNCNESYRALSNLYTEMQKVNERENKAEYGVHLCIDVEDAMNITRKLWSQFFNCSVPCHDTVPVAAVSVFILFLTVVFYLSSFLHSEQKKRKLILPKRLKSSTSFANIQENSH